MTAPRDTLLLFPASAKNWPENFNQEPSTEFKQLDEISCGLASFAVQKKSNPFPCSYFRSDWAQVPWLCVWDAEMKSSDFSKYSAPMAFSKIIAFVKDEKIVKKFFPQSTIEYVERLEDEK